MHKLKIAFFGTPDFAADVLKQVLDDTELPVEVQFVVTQPDRPAGRERVLTASPVKLLAKDRQIPVWEDIQSAEIKEQLKTVDLVLLYAFGALLPAELLTLPRFGFWNIHPSLLPLYRGTAPIAYTLLMGDTETGVSLMELDAQWDHGPLIDQEKYFILTHETQELLKKRLSDIGYKLFKKNVQLLIDGKLQKHEQNHLMRTFTRMITKQDGYVPFAVVKKMLDGQAVTEQETPPIIDEYRKKYRLDPVCSPAVSYFNLYRALYPWPGLWTVLPSEKRLKITRMEIIYSKPVITHVQLEGKKEVDIKTFREAYHI